MEQVVIAERNENFKKCISGRYPSLCNYSLLTTEQLSEVKRAEMRVENTTQTTEQNETDSAGEDDMKDAEKKGFVSIAYTLINDAFDLMPAITHDLQENNEIDEIIDAALNATTTTSTNFSLDSKNCGTQLAQIIFRVYGIDPPEDVVLPQSAYYDGYKIPKDIANVVKTELKKIGDSPTAYRDKYNLAFNIFINQLISDYKQTKKKMPIVPKEGAYLRSDDKHLYPYEVSSK